MDDRQRAKRSFKDSSDPMERDYYNSLQEAIKVLMNSFYGVFASYFYRFTDRSIGASITAYARESILSIISSLSAEGIRVIYSDTDSVFIESPTPDLERTIEFGKGLSERFSKGATYLEFEKVFQSFFTHGKKKRYIGKQIWPSEDIVVRGYEMRRTDAFDLQSDALNGLFQDVLDGRIDEGLTGAREIIRKCRAGEVDISSLVISRSVQEVEDERIESAYKNPDSLTNIQALRKTKEMGIEVVPGMKVSWIVVDGRSSPQVVEPYIDGKPFSSRPDYQYYAERLASTLSRVTEVFGVDDKELLTGASQSSLFDSFGTSSDGDAPKGPASPRKKAGPIKDAGKVNLDRWV
jgi:DNA polymerase I